MSSGNRVRSGESLDHELKAAEEEMDRIQHQRDEIARKKAELEALSSRKHLFLTQQVELTEKLTACLTLIDRELFEMRQESDDLEQCRACFAAHLDKIQKFNPEAWDHDKLDKHTMAIDIATDEYDQAAAHFQNGRSGAIFGRPSKRGRTASAAARTKGGSEFMQNLRNGLAFNLPMIILGTLALLIYLSK